MLLRYRDASRPGLPALRIYEFMAFIALLVLLAQNLGLGKTYPWGMLPYDLGRWLWLVLSLGLLALLLEQVGLVRFGRRWQRGVSACERALGHRAAFIGLLAYNALFAVVSYNHFGRFGYAFPWAHLVLLAAAAAFVRRDRFWLSCLVSLGLLAASVIHFPLAVERSGMLPGIQAAWNNFAIGRSPVPYPPNPQAGYWAILFSLPGIFFSHGPAWVLGLDLRWGQAVWRLAWMLVIGTALGKHAPGSPWRTVAHVFVLNPYYNFRHDLYFEGFLFLVAAYHAWPAWRWLCLPALGWTRPSAWVMAPFLALDWLVNRRREAGGAPLEPRLDWRRIARQAGWLALGTGLVTAAVALPWWRSTPLSLLVMRSRELAAPQPAFEYGLTLGPLASTLGVSFVLQPLQAALSAVLGLWTLWCWWSRRAVAAEQAAEAIERMGLVTLCAIVLLNPYFELYFWFDAGFWMLAAYAPREPERRRPLRGALPAAASAR